MAVQILGLREWMDTRQQKMRKREAFFEQGWRAPSVAELFAHFEEYVNQIPQDERFNMYYTVASCVEEKGRKLETQTVIPFDIDGIDVDRASEVARAVCDAMGVEWDKTGIVFSGHGVQVLIDQPIEVSAEETFEAWRPYYKGACGKINLELMDRGLQGSADVSVWSPARLMRLPGTLNRKPNKPERMAEMLQRNMVKQPFNLKDASGVIDVAPRDQIAQSVVGRLPRPDSKAVQAECEFLKHCRTNQNKVSEGQWYAMLSIAVRLDDGPELVHEYSREYHGYSEHETSLKAEQALANSGPRTCSNIDSLWDGCKNCKHYQSDKVKSPIMIQGPDYILTEKSGFHTVTTDQNGNKKPGKPVVEDLRRFFERQYRYVTMMDSQMVFVWNGKAWEEIENSRLENFAYEHFNPKVGSSIRSEFIRAVQCTNLRPADWFSGSTDRRINFANGVLNIDTGELETHSPEYGFRYVLPYEYDPTANCPNFDSFMRDITLDRLELENVLLEFIGYAFSGDECWEHKALMLLGTGRNGKSTLMHIIQALAGKGTYSSITLTDMKQETMRQQLDGRLFNMAEETSPSALADSSIFKNVVAGGEILVKKLYKQPYTIRNRCKLIFSCNELPHSKDKTDALYRRMLIVPFDNKFEGDRRDPHIEQRILTELPGIFNRILDGYRRLITGKSFSDSAVVREQVEAYEQSNDAVLNFFQDELVVHSFIPDGPGATMKEIYQAYRFYCDNVYGERPLPMPHFYAQLKRRIPAYDKRRVREMMGGVRERKLIGVMLAKGQGSF